MQIRDLNCWKITARIWMVTAPVRLLSSVRDCGRRDMARESRRMMHLWAALWSSNTYRRAVLLTSEVRKREQAVEIISKLCLFDADRRSVEEQEILLYELKNAFLKFIEVSRGGRGFTSIAFGMGQLSDEGVAKKIADQISSIAFDAPHMLHMDKEFAILQSAALAAFRQEYLQQGAFLKKMIAYVSIVPVLALSHECMDSKIE